MLDNLVCLIGKMGEDGCIARKKTHFTEVILIKVFLDNELNSPVEQELPKEK